MLPSARAAPEDTSWSWFGPTATLTVPLQVPEQGGTAINGRHAATGRWRMEQTRAPVLDKSTVLLRIWSGARELALTTPTKRARRSSAD